MNPRHGLGSSSVFCLSFLIAISITVLTCKSVKNLKVADIQASDLSAGCTVQVAFTLLGCWPFLFWITGVSLHLLLWCCSLGLSPFCQESKLFSSSSSFNSGKARLSRNGHSRSRAPQVDQSTTKDEVLHSFLNIATVRVCFKSWPRSSATDQRHNKTQISGAIQDWLWFPLCIWKLQTGPRTSSEMSAGMELGLASQNLLLRKLTGHKHMCPAAGV